MKIIGLTGGIASGKSTACAYLRELGAAVVDADGISRSCTKKGNPGFDAVLSHFGSGILADNGEIDRKVLGAIVFHDEEKLKDLNALLHPIIIQMSKDEIELHRKNGESVCILDVPLLFETGMDVLCDETWLIYVPVEEQVKRLFERDGIGREAALARIASQMPLSEKLKLADKTIDSSGTIEETQEKLLALWREI